MSKKTKWRNASTDEITAGTASYHSKLDRYIVLLEPIVPEPVVEPIVPEPIAPEPTTLYVYAASTGLGTAISVLSMLVHTNLKVELTTTHGSVYVELCNIFNIQNVTVVIGTLQEKHINLTSHDWTKIASPYFADNSYAHEQHDLNLGNPRPYIAVVANNGSNAYEIEYNIREGDTGGEYPFNRFYSIDLYSKIYRLVHMAGYDIVTFNQPGPAMTLAKKVDLLKHCSAVIGYEGGIMHLAHVMQIPAIILPWRSLLPTSAQWQQDLLTYVVDALHLDKRTYILSSADEIIAWSREKLNAIIQRCTFQHGNNKLYRCHQGDQLVDTFQLKWRNNEVGENLLLVSQHNNTEFRISLSNSELSIFQNLPGPMRLGGP